MSSFEREGSLPKCGQGMWLNPGGDFLVLACARVFKLSPHPTQDLRYVGSLDRYDGTLDTIYSKRLDRFLSGVSFHPPGRTGSGLAMHEPRTLGLERRVTWQSAASMGSVHALYQASNGRIYVLAWNVRAATQSTMVVGIDL